MLTKENLEACRRSLWPVYEEEQVSRRPDTRLDESVFWAPHVATLCPERAQTQCPSDRPAEGQIAADRAWLESPRGPVVTVTTAAFAALPVTLRPAPSMTLIGRYAEDVPPVRFDPLPDASAPGVIGRSAAGSESPKGRNLGSMLGWALLAVVLVAAVVILIAR